MSNANVTLVQSLYAAFQRGDIATIVNATAANIRWEITGRRSDFPLLGMRSGHPGVQEFFATLAETQDVTDFSPREFYSADDKVFVTGHYGWKLRKTGKSVDSDWVHIFTINNGEVTEFREFTDTAKFAEAYRK